MRRELPGMSLFSILTGDRDVLVELAGGWSRPPCAPADTFEANWGGTGSCNRKPEFFCNSEATNLTITRYLRWSCQVEVRSQLQLSFAQNPFDARIMKMNCE